MSTRSRASQWFGPRSASAPLQYKAPPQEPIYIGWDFGSSQDRGVTWITPNGIYYMGELSSEPQVLCFSQPMALDTQEPQMSDFKVGDVVRVKKGTGTTAVVERVKGELVWIRGDQFGAWRGASLELVSRPSDAKPELKAGDRVCVRYRGTGTIEGPHDTRGHWVRMDGDPKPGSMYCRDDLLELLPPEPVPAKPMTATAASILRNNQTDPMLDPEYTHEMDAMRYMALNLLDAAATREQAIARGVKVEDNRLVKADGWMPAGTYMLLGEEDEGDDCGEGSTAPDSTFTFVRYKCMDIPLTGEGGPGIAKSIPHCERRFPSRISTWNPMDDTFLEDA